MTARILTALGGVFLVLILVNVYLFTSNRSLQADVNSRQQFITQSLQLEQLNKEIIVALANLAVRDKDAALSDVLTSQGISVSATPNTAAGPAGGTPAESATAARR
jgi:predicted Holliday junction resolvase-like endonuclease